MSLPVVLIIGLGEIGKPLFNQIKKTYPQACGIDLQPVDITAPVALMHVCYPFTPTNSFIATTAEYARKYAPKVIIINSTVAPGTTRAIAARTGTPVVYSPVRGKHTNMAADLVHYHKFIAGTDDAAVTTVAAHFDNIGLHTTKLSTPEALELAKLLETTYFGLLIAFAQNMNRFAHACDADYNEIHKFFKEIDYLPHHLFTPGYIGGHCVMPNIALLKTQFTSELLDAIVASNQRQGEELGKTAVEREHSKDRIRITPRIIDEDAS
jgi:UDP-N-acetyl-D-mannosaminuronate dehydrogenase